MINSKEIFVECNLNSSHRIGDNSFTTTIGGGIILEAGDTVEIDNVAINDKGIGGNMIEIPKENIGSSIATNKVSLEVGKYITTGSRFCLPLPFTGYQIYGTIESPHYGYAAEMYEGTTAASFADFTAQGKLPFYNGDFVAGFKNFRGAHHYERNQYIYLGGNGTDAITKTNKILGIKLHSVVAPLDVKNSTSTIRQTLPPYEMKVNNLYDFEKALCNINVNKGYETAENIARHITDTFHEGFINDPYNDTEIKIVMPNAAGAGDFYTAGAVNTSITNAFVNIKVANGIDNRVNVGDGSSTNEIGFNNKNALYETVYHKDPYRYIYGERLNWLSERYEKIKPNGADPAANQKVVNLIRLKGNGLNDGDVIITNLYAQNLFYSKEYFEVGTAVNNMKVWIDFCRYNEKYMLKSPASNFQNDTKNWSIFLDLGRYNDEVSSQLNTCKSSDGAPAKALQPSFQKENGAGMTTDSQCCFCRLGHYSRFNAEIYDNKSLTASQVADGYTFIEHFSDGTGTWDTKGNIISVRQFCEDNNIMLCLLGNKNDGFIRENNGYNLLVGFFSNGYSDVEAAANNDSGYKNVPNKYITIQTFITTEAEMELYNGGYYGFDPFFTRNTCAIAINTQSSGATGANVIGLNKSQAYINFIQTGSPNANCVFDEDLQHFSLANLHFPYMNDTGLPMIKLGVQAKIIAASTAATVAASKDWITPFPTDISAVAEMTAPLFWGYSGSTILDVKGYDDNETGFENPIDIDETNYKYTLLYRLGFDYLDLFGLLGSPSALYNPSTKDFKLFPYKQPRPITTNPKIISTYQLALGLNYVSPLYSVAQSLIWAKSFDLNVSCNVATETNVESAEIIASRVPTRLNNPYWLVQSNIIPSSNYINNNGKLKNVLSIVNRAYTSNDFAYGMSVATRKVVENPQTLTEITTTIFNNDFSTPKLDENTIVVYKITKNYQMENRILKANIEQMEKKS